MSGKPSKEGAAQAIAMIRKLNNLSNLQETLEAKCRERAIKYGMQQP